MALLQNFTDLSGNSYTPAYWRAVSINISAVGQAINLTFYAYKDSASFAADKQPLPGGVKNYVITGSDFLSVASAAPVGASLYDVLAHASEEYAVGKLDTDTGQKDAGGKPVMASFFAAAQQV
jgi:hypothetical protein